MAIETTEAKVPGPSADLKILNAVQLRTFGDKNEGWKSRSGDNTRSRVLAISCGETGKKCLRRDRDIVRRKHRPDACNAGRTGVSAVFNCTWRDAAER
jgi:hypothetical protein